MKKVLITGASGFIGKNLVENLQAQYDIVPVCRKDADLLEEEQVRQLFQKENIDVVIHAATQGTLGRGIEYENQLLKNNMQMFLNLEKQHDAYGKLIILGSGAEYDKRRSLTLVKETDFGERIPVDNYGISKFIMSKIIEKTENIYNLRLFGIFGPYENYNYRFISNVICKALVNRDIKIHQNVLFDYMYIKDFCKIIPWFIDHTPSSHFFNVCTATRSDLVSIAEEVLRQTESKSRLLVEKSGWNKEYSGDNSRMKEAMGNISFTPVEKAIEEMIDFYKNTPFQLEGNY